MTDEPMSKHKYQQRIAGKHGFCSLIESPHWNWNLTFLKCETWTIKIIHNQNQSEKQERKRSNGEEAKRTAATQNEDDTENRGAKNGKQIMNVYAEDLQSQIFPFASSSRWFARRTTFHIQNEM